MIQRNSGNVGAAACVVWVVCIVIAAITGGAETTPPSAAQNVSADSVPSSTEITLRDAVSRALIQSPELASFEWRIRAAEARELQAGLRKNPELSFEIEDVRWRRAPDARTHTATRLIDAAGLTETRDVSVEEGNGAGLGESQMTLRLSQIVELGGKRAKRVQAAGRQKELARWDYEAARLDILSKVSQSFVETLAAQERIDLAAGAVAVAEQIVAAAAARVEAGKVSPLEQTKAETQLAAARISRDKTALDLDTARAALAALWAANTPDFDRVTGDFESIAPAPAFEDLTAALEKNPDLARWADEIEARRAALDLERSRRVPDLTLTLGLRTTEIPSHSQRGWSSDSSGAVSWTDGKTVSDRGHENLLVFEAGVPLPLFDRNQGGIKEVECEAYRAEADRRQAEVRVHSALFAAHRTLAQSYGAAAALRDEVLPRAHDTLQRTQEGYRQGKFGYLDVLDAQRTLFEVRAQYLDALTAYHRAMNDVDRLIGALPGGEPSAGDEGPVRAAPKPKETKHDRP